jgi:glucan phosphoethanolaminetransferase (alkaline phosphatase superfamily)
MLLTIVENFADARAFLESDLKRIMTGLVPLLVGYGYGLWRIRDLRITTPWWAAFAPLAAAVAVYLVVLRYVGSWDVVLLNDHDSPFGLAAQGYVATGIYEKESIERDLAKSFHFGAERPSAPADPEIYVLVIGESARRHNWSLYGYPRDTNPRLSKTDNLIIFQDVVTQVAQTQVSVPLIIARGSIADPQRNRGEKSIVSVFGEVGFKTFWFSTQERETAMAAISRYSNEADSVRFLEHEYDKVLVDSLRDVLSSHGAAPKMFFLLHTLGSHFNLSSRYPPPFAAFPDGRGSSILGGTSASLTHAELIGAYDNTILYTDFVLSDIIETLRGRPGIKAMFYIPDHGDNLRDDARNLFGHAHSNEYDLPIATLFWYSTEYAQRYPDKIANARANAARRLTTRTVFYSLTDMADISLADPDVARLSVFSADLKDVKRIVFGYPTPFDFDEWMERTNMQIPKVVPPT